MNDTKKLPLPIIIVFLLVAVILSTVETGIAIGQGDHPIHLSYVYHVIDPELFPGDPFVATVEQYPSIFWKAIAVMGRAGIPVDLLLYGGHILFRVIAVIGLFYLYRELSRMTLDCDEATHACVAIAGTFGTLGMNVIHWGGTYMLEETLETSTAAFSVLPWVWYAWLRRAWPAWAISFGVLAWIHPMIALYVGLIFLCVWLAEEKLYNPMTDEGRAFWLKGGIPAAILTGGAIFYAWLQRTPMDPAMKDAWVVISRYRLGHHLFPSGWPMTRFAIWSGIAVVVLGACVYTAKGRLRRVLVAGFFPVAALAILGIAAPYVYPSPTLLSLCLWRSPMAWTIAGYGILVPLVFRLFGPYLTSGRLSALAIAGSLIMLTGLSLFKIQRRESYTPTEDRRAVEDWVQENTAKDALILAPPQLGGIRTEAMRPSFVEWKDGSAILWDAVYTRDVWMARLAAIAGEKRIDPVTGLERPPKADEAEEDYSRLLREPERLSRLATENDIDYIFTNESVGEGFTSTFGNPVVESGAWAVYRVADGARGN